MSEANKKVYGCETCGWRMIAEQKPNSWKGRLWRWHTKICPGWKAYQRAVKEGKAQ